MKVILIFDPAVDVTTEAFQHALKAVGSFCHFRDLTPQAGLLRQKIQAISQHCKFFAVYNILAGNQNYIF